MSVPGYGKAKGGQFERDVCRKLSLWLSHNENPNLLWRSAMSGGRATLQKRLGKTNFEQSGDISAVGEEGHNLTKRFYLECKFYKDLGIANFLLGRPSKLGGFWETALSEARDVSKVPLLIAKENRLPELAISTGAVFKEVLFKKSFSYTMRSGYSIDPVIVFFFDKFLDCCYLNNLEMHVNGEVKLDKNGNEIKCLS